MSGKSKKLMDFFGIGQAMRGMALTYSQSSRATGRTVSMVDSVKDGDRICSTNMREAERVKRLCRERGVKVDCIVIPTHAPEKIFEHGTSIGRTIFDHSWVEDYYLKMIDRANNDIVQLQQQSSGFGEAHRETRRKAIEMGKWQF